jgi:hypothetical protein
MFTPMHIPTGKIVLTYEDYVLLPNDRNRYEILEGELSVTPASSTKHPFDLILDPTTILQPDLLFVFSAHQHIITERAVEGAFLIWL